MFYKVVLDEKLFKDGIDETGTAEYSYTL